MSNVDMGAVLAGFGRGETDAMYQAVLVEIAAHRESRVMEAAYALNDRDANQALGAVKALDDLKEKLAMNVMEAQERLREGEEKKAEG